MSGKSAGKRKATSAAGAEATGKKAKAAASSTGPAATKPATTKKKAALPEYHPAYDTLSSVWAILHQRVEPDDYIAFRDERDGAELAEMLGTEVIGTYATKEEAQKAAQEHIKEACTDPECTDGGHEPKLDGEDSDSDEDEERECCFGDIPRIPLDLSVDKFERGQCGGSATGDVVWIEEVPFGRRK